MLSKQFRFNIVQLMFNYIFRLENELETNIDDLLLLTTTSEEKEVLGKIISEYDKSKSVISPFLQNYTWERTPYLNRSILCTFVFELKLCESNQISKTVAEYLHLTQDLAGSDSVGMVHAVIGKIIAN